MPRKETLKVKSIEIHIFIGELSIFNGQFTYLLALAKLCAKNNLVLPNKNIIISLFLGKGLLKLFFLPKFFFIN